MSKPAKKSGITVAKFGGSAIASKQGIKKFLTLLKSEKSVLAVISAAGKNTKGERKLTDLLFDFYKEKNDKNASAIKNALYDFFTRALNFSEKLAENRAEKSIYYLRNTNLTKDESISRGEYFTCRAISSKFCLPLIPPEKTLFLNEKNRSVNLKKTKKAFRDLFSTIKKPAKAIMPGFYGCLNGKLKLLPRGGGDLSGAAVAFCLNAEVYKNYTDIDGIKNAPPDIIKNAKTFKRIAYSNLKRLICAGAEVLSTESAALICAKKIKTQILNAKGEKGSPRTLTAKKQKGVFKAICLKNLEQNLCEITILGKSFKSKKFRKKALKLFRKNGIIPRKTKYDKNGARFLMQKTNAEIAVKLLYYNFLSVKFSR